MKIKFWGVRGSIPTPERRNSRYGGNTACIEVRLSNRTLIIFDCGSGIRALGKSLMREYGQRPIEAYVFMTHFHWDHVQGIPFFMPLYREGNFVLFHSALGDGDQLRKALEGQMVHPHFPVDPSLMRSVRHFVGLGHQKINLNGAIISAAHLNHPQGCVGYRLEADESVFVLATDTEPGSPKHDHAVRELAQGADILVYDAQYTPDQLRQEKKGWGHSSWQDGVNIARESGVQRLLLFHHDPDHDDFMVESLVECAQRELANVGGAAEGLEIDLSQKQIVWGYTTSAKRRQETPIIAPPS